MTPRQFHALRKRCVEQWQREELLFGTIAASVANFSFSPPKTPLTPESFMMHPIKRKEAGPTTGDQLLAAVSALPYAVMEKV
jgi:hypothetical protein